MTYSEKLKDPRWLKKREEILNRDSWQCRRCRKSENLHVHHIRYIKGRDPWEYHEFYLVTLCAKHHEEEHEEIERAYAPAPAPVKVTKDISPEVQAALDRVKELKRQFCDEHSTMTEEQMRANLNESRELRKKYRILQFILDVEKEESK